jgi:hypothetical protein
MALSITHVRARYDHPTLSNKSLQEATHSVENDRLVQGHNDKEDEIRTGGSEPVPLKAVWSQI